MKAHRLFAVAAVILMAAPVSAVSFYGELKTARQFPILSDVTITATLDVDFNPLDLDFDADWSAGGLGNGYVNGTPKIYTHTFDPGTSPVDVQSAWLYVSVIDDLSPLPDLAKETAVVQIGQDVLDSGQASLNILGGNVTAYIDSAGDTLTVTVRASRGDFWLTASALKVVYDAPARPGGASPAVPEPGAALAFGVGMLLVGRRSLRR
jgi:hypothetical protein